jgi:hypothetical protein
MLRYATLFNVQVYRVLAYAHNPRNASHALLVLPAPVREIPIKRSPPARALDRLQATMQKRGCCDAPVFSGLPTGREYSLSAWSQVRVAVPKGAEKRVSRASRRGKQPPGARLAAVVHAAQASEKEKRADGEGESGDAAGGAESRV